MHSSVTPDPAMRWTAAWLAPRLVVVSLVYLALPHLIFWFGWLRLPYAAVAAIVLVAGLGVVWRMLWRRVKSADNVQVAGAQLTEVQNADATVRTSNAATLRFTRQDALMIGALCLVWLTLAGVGGFASQDLDWNKHNTVLNSLMHKPWPTVYAIYQVDVPLVYYIAYYLPAALVGKVGGWVSMNVALYVWSALGLAIALLWFWLLVHRVAYVALLIFIGFSGLDVIGKTFAWLGVWNIAERNWQHIDSWAGVWQYSSHATLLNWVPPQAIGGWITTGMLLYCMITLRRPALILLPFGLSALWSPFVTLGLLPYLLIGFLTDKTPFAARLRQLISLPNAAGLLTLALTAFYYSAKLTAGSPVVIQDLLSGVSLGSYNGPIQDAIAFLIFFCIIEFGLYVIVLYSSGAVQDERWRWFFDITVLVLCILPWFKLGVYNDLVMRASIPALFVLAVVVTRAVLDNTVPRSARTMLVVLLLVGAVTPAIEFKRHVERTATQPAPLFDPATQRWDFVYYMQRQTFFFGQYAGAIDAPFFQMIGKAKPTVAPSPAHEPESEEAKHNAHDFVLYADVIYLLRDRTLVSPTVAAGETFTVTIEAHYFGAKYSPDYVPALQLVDGEGEAVWSTTGWPRRGWPRGEPEISPFWMTLWAGEFPIALPETLAPGEYRVMAGFTASQGEEGGMLPAASVPEGEPLGDFVPVAAVEVAER